MTTSKTPATPRPSVLSLNINSKSALYAAYMPFLANGGVFVPTTRNYKLGDEVFMLLQLMEDPTRHAIAGTVAWVTPEGCQGNKTQGIGVHLNTDNTCKTLRGRIESLLAGTSGSKRATYTL